MTGIYIHFPFCIKKCFYCDFYSLEQLDQIDIFIENLCKEIELHAAIYPITSKIDTIFFGGGTPSLLKPEHLNKILNTLNTYLTIEEFSEITLECNPGTVDIQYLEEYKKIGINRLSFGVQSFVDKELEFLERIHTADEALRAIKTAQDIGFDNISLDLIFSLPNQTISQWNKTLSKAIKLNPDHISAYSLIYEQGTPLHKQWQQGKIKKLDEDSDAELYIYTMKKLRKYGYEQYEVSNYTRNNKPSRHNLKYWYGDDYIAFGPSAHGKRGRQRYWNYSSLAKYNKLIQEGKLPIEGNEELSNIDIFFESIFLQLRAKGFNILDFEEKFGMDLMADLAFVFSEYVPEKYFEVKDDWVCLTAKGYCFADEISTEIMSRLEEAI